MARPLKQGLEYFPLDVDIDQDDKIAMIEAIHGIQGFGIVIKILSKIYKEGYFYEWTKREQVLFSKRINVDINMVLTVVNDCIGEGVFNKNLFEEYNVLTSKGIQSRYLEAVKRRKQVTFIKEYMLIQDVKSIIGTNKIDVFLQELGEKGVNVNINPSSKGLNDNISTQRKGKENRTEERKQENPQKVVVNPFKFYQENFGVLSPFVSEDIGNWIDDTSEELVIEAMKITLKQQKYWKYATGILKDWHSKNLKTVSDVQAYNKEYENKKGDRTGKSKISKEDFNLDD